MLPAVSDQQILEQYLRNTRGVRGVVRALGVSQTRVGRVVKAYLDGRLKRGFS